LTVVQWLIYLELCAVGISTGVDIWRISFGFQLVPTGILVVGLFTVRVCLSHELRRYSDSCSNKNPSWLASVNRHEEALKNLAYLRQEDIDSENVLDEN